MDPYGPRRNTMINEIGMTTRNIAGFTFEEHYGHGESEYFVNDNKVNAWQYKTMMRALQPEEEKFENSIVQEDTAEYETLINPKYVKRNKKVDVPTEQWQKSIEKRIEALERDSKNTDVSLDGLWNNVGAREYEIDMLNCRVPNYCPKTGELVVYDEDGNDFHTVDVGLPIDED